MNAAAIILARGGSKGVPGKNIMPIAGRPCIEWTIDAAKQSRLLRLIAVSTDDAAIARTAESAGVRVVARPAPLADDRATVDDAARHAAAELGQAFDAFVILYANVPVRPLGLVDRALELLARGCDSVQSYAPVGKHHPWWTARLDEHGAVRPWEGDVLNHSVYRRQDLPPAYIPDGGIIAVTREALFLKVPGVQPGPHAFFGRDRRGVINPEGAVVDIDAPTDALVADALLRSAR